MRACNRASSCAVRLLQKTDRNTMMCCCVAHVGAVSLAPPKRMAAFLSIHLAQNCTDERLRAVSFFVWGGVGDNGLSAVAGCCESGFSD